LSRANPRRSSWEFLRDLERDGGYLNIEIANLHERLDPQDRAFATELLFGSFRMRLLLDDIIDRMSSRPIDEETRSVLRLGIYEALFMTTADHAVVNEYVEIAKMVIGKARAGFINALLRRAVREREELSDVSTLPIEIKTSHPSWIVDAYRSLMGSAELEAELDSHNQAAKVQVVSFEPLPEEIATRSPLTSFGYRLNTTPREIEAIRRGRAFVQDEGSQIVCELALATDPERKMQWMDLCAGPGGKFSFLAHFLAPDQLQGNELHPHRVKLIKARTPNHVITTTDARTLSRQDMRFDRILIDAPCTGMGALRRRPDSRWRRTENDLKVLVKLQREILDSASEMVNVNGLIFYVTCSPHLMETKAQVRDFLSRHTNFVLDPITSDAIPTAARSQWSKAIDAEGCLQLLTARDGTDAMFMAMLRRTS